MTIEALDREVTYTADGSTVTFSVPFNFFEIGVYVNNTLVSAADYTITQDNVGGTGSVTFNTAPLSGRSVYIKGTTEMRQGVDYRELDSFPAESHERALDRLTMIVQELARDVADVLALDIDGGITAGERTKIGRIIDVRTDYGAFGDGTSDDTAELNAAIVAAADDANGASVIVDLGGQTYAVSSTVTVLENVRLINGELKAIGTSWTSGTPVLQTQGSRSSVEFVEVDSNHVAQTGILASGNCHHFAVRSIRATEKCWRVTGSSKFDFCTGFQFTSGDASFGTQAARTARAWSIETVDNILANCIGAWSLYPLYVDTNCTNNTFTGCHFYNGIPTASGGPAINPYIVWLNRAANQMFSSCYFDNGIFRVTKPVLNDPRITFGGCLFYRDHTGATISNWFEMDTPDASSTLKDIKGLADAVFTSTDGTALNMFSFVTTSGGTWSGTQLSDVTRDLMICNGPLTIYRGDTTIGRVTSFRSSHTDRALSEWRSHSTSHANGPEAGADGNDFLVRTNNTQRVRVRDSDGTLHIGSSFTAGSQVNRRGDSFYVLAKSGVSATHTGNTNETALATVTLPGGSLGPNGMLRITSYWSHTNNANTKTCRIRLGGIAGSALFTSAVTTTASTRDVRTVHNRNSQSSQVLWLNTSTALGPISSAILTYTVATASDQDIVFSAQLANAADSITLEGYCIEVLYGA